MKNPPPLDFAIPGFTVKTLDKNFNSWLDMDTSLQEAAKTAKKSMSKEALSDLLWNRFK
jgi:hypothetical protein